jgi:hypothetical protein
MPGAIDAAQIVRPEGSTTRSAGAATWATTEDRPAGSTRKIRLAGKSVTNNVPSSRRSIAISSREGVVA